MAVSTSNAAVRQAFDKFRVEHGPAWGPRAGIVKDASEADSMVESDGLSVFYDGPGPLSGASQNLAPLRSDALPGQRRLWVVRSDDVVHAAELCSFGDTRTAGRVKHTNLTGGAPAFSGGELLFLDSGALIVSGDSGRYGARSSEEMKDVAIAFSQSGYTVYSLGYDEEAARALPLVSVAPQLV